MSTVDFPVTEIDVRYYTDEFGPYSFDFTDALPSSTTEITSVTIRAFEGAVKPGDDLSALPDVGSLLAEADPGLSGKQIFVNFQYPGDSYKGKRYTLVFELTVDSITKHPFYFRYIRVR